MEERLLTMLSNSSGKWKFLISLRVFQLQILVQFYSMLVTGTDQVFIDQTEENLESNGAGRKVRKEKDVK